MDYQLDKQYVSLSALIKADKQDSNVIYVEASNQLDDSQSDVVLQKALRDEVKSFLKKGVISWNHLHKLENDPKYICGEPVDVAFPADGRTLVKARMYPSNPYAQTILQMARDGSSRLGASIGGFILQRKQELNKSLILKVMWDEVAITHQPVNEGTLGAVAVMPFSEFNKSFCADDTTRLEELQKALSAGYGTDSATFTGGRALQTESLMGADKAKMQDAFKVVLKNLRQKKVKNYNDMVSVLPDGLKSYAAIVATALVANIENVKKIILHKEDVR